LLGLHDRGTNQMNRNSTSSSASRAMSTLTPNWPSGSNSTSSPDHTAIRMGKRLTKRSEKSYRNMKRFPVRSPTLQRRTRDRCGLYLDSYQQPPRRYHSPVLLHALSRLQYDGKVLPTRSDRKPRTETREGKGLELEKQSLCRRREGTDHLRLNSGLEGDRIKTDGFTCSRSFVYGKQRSHVGKPFFAVGLGRRL
jgi:hypothetical protein